MVVLMHWSVSLLERTRERWSSRSLEVEDLCPLLYLSPRFLSKSAFVYTTTYNSQAKNEVHLICREEEWLSLGDVALLWSPLKLQMSYHYLAMVPSEGRNSPDSRQLTKGERNGPYSSECCSLSHSHSCFSPRSSSTSKFQQWRRLASTRVSNKDQWLKI